MGFEFETARPWPESIYSRPFFNNCITNISYKKLGSAGGTKIKIKSVLPVRDEKRN